MKKLFNEQLAAYRAPDNLYKFVEFEKNREKNRYLDVVCLDHSRVVLTFESPPCTNYIHASWVRFEKHDRVFIVTQAPLQNTIEDFWRMIFQENCSMIINLTNEMEDTDRLAQYFPPKPGAFTNYGRMFVNTKKMEDEVKFMVYTLEVLPDGCSNSLLLKLIQVKSSFAKSPSTTMILRMLRIMGSTNRVATGPVVVHCASGVGRASTLVLIDVILQRLFFSQQPVDMKLVVEMFRHLRDQRASCLQRDTQFLFVISSVVDYIGTRFSSRYGEKRDKFKEDYQNCMGIVGALCLHKNPSAEGKAPMST
ncbi:Protein-tyrosine phosphatase [Dictyocaulus viviparus]|uniref:Protein-tyrosine phosphatase n=1 Tax=Dictyocaulus viviparus TaxID=29172 RepID=A0A0D8Y624_DICVI|nr:Protein-tyrosine phosphatase [Dictyocaulus viviparus]